MTYPISVGAAVSVKIFLSAVSDEFRDYRDQLRADLTRHNVEVKVQEDFKDLGGVTLDKLDIYISSCDAVVHLVGDMTGAAAKPASTQAILAKYPDITERLQPLREPLMQGQDISYTQWEAWLALYHYKKLLIAKAEVAAPRGQDHKPSEASRAAQQAHLDRLRAVEHYPSSTFSSPDQLAKQIAYTTILDLLANERGGPAHSAGGCFYTGPGVLVVNPSGPVITAGRDIAGPVNVGLDEKKVEEHIAVAQKPLRDQLEELAIQVAREKGVEVAPLRAILVKMGEAGVYDEDIPKRLDEKADELIKLREESARLRRGPAELTSFAKQAEALIYKGDFDAARAALAEGRATARTLRELSSRYEAEFLAQEARVDHLQLAYRPAAAKYAEAAGLVAPFDQRRQWAFRLAQADELRSQGLEFGDNAALSEAINVYRDSLLLAPRAQRPFDWAAIQNNLGIALLTLGERESGTARLEEAVVALREALKEWTHERAPLEWAMTQNNLGNALWRLGERESGTERLKDAVVACRNALMVRTRDRVPLDWAMTFVRFFHSSRSVDLLAYDEKFHSRYRTTSNWP